MRQNQPSYYPFDAKSVEFLPAEDATMPPIPLVRAAFGVPVLKVLRAIGVAEAEFRRVGIPIYAEPTPITLMPEKPWWELLGNVSRREDIADLGLLAGQCLPFSEIQSVAPQLGGCRTLHELLVRFCRIAPLQSTAARFELVHSHDGSWLRDVGQPLLENRTACAQLRLFRLLGMIQIVQMVLGKHWRPDQVLLPFPHRAGIADSVLLGAERVRFDQPYGAIRIPGDCLATPLPLSCVDVGLPSAIKNIDDMTIPPSEFVESLRALITYHLGGEALSVAFVARNCGMSIRTFQRRLGASGLSFSQLLGQSRLERARHLLKSGGVSLSDVAYLLGYSDYTKFSRAFQRRTGQTPRGFRESQGSGDVVCFPGAA